MGDVHGVLSQWYMQSEVNECLVLSSVDMNGNMSPNCCPLSAVCCFVLKLFIISVE